MSSLGWQGGGGGAEGRVWLPMGEGNPTCHSNGREGDETGGGTPKYVGFVAES